MRRAFALVKLKRVGIRRLALDHRRHQTHAGSTVVRASRLDGEKPHRRVAGGTFMSKQSDAKAIQNYSEKPFVKTCSNCRHFRSDLFTIDGGFYPSFQQEKNLRCNLGGFKVKKTALCDAWEAKQ
jgi:hypothetical protein